MRKVNFLMFFYLSSIAFPSVFTPPAPPEILKLPRIAFAPFISQPPEIDGNLKENEWLSEGKQGHFVVASTLWELAKEDTDFWLCRDNEKIFIAFRARYTSLDKVVRRKDRNVWGNDTIEILIQPPEGIRGKYWYHIAVDPVGNVWFAREREIPEMPGTYNIEETKHNIIYKATLNSEHWIAEISIPLTDLKTGNNSFKDDWRGNFCRTQMTEYIHTCWNLTQAFQNPDNFGKIIFTDSNRALNNEKSYLEALNAYQNERQSAIDAWQKRKPLYNFRYAYNFGPPDGPVQDGYIQIHPGSIYSPEKGYGWVGSTEGIVAQTLDDLGENRARGAKLPGVLASSWIYATGPDTNGRVVHRFRVDVPDGEYKVHILSGILAQERFLPQRRKFTIYCNGSKVIDLDIGHFMYARPFFRCRTSNGKLEFTFDGPAEILPDPVTQELDPDGMKKNFVPGWLVNALVIYPVKDRKLAERQIELDQISLLYLSPDELTKLEYEKHPEEKESVKYTDEEKKQGFVIFQRAMGRRIYPESRPRREEIKETLSIRVVPGEPAYITFGLLPLKDLDMMEISISDIKGTGGKIPSSDIRIREAQYRPWKAGGAKYSIEPVFLDEYLYLDHDINEGECRWFWISFKTPEDASSGKYEGTITLSSRSSSNMKIKLTVEVLPFRTVDVPFRYGGFYPGGYGKPWPVYMDIFARAFAEAGITTLGLYYDSYRGDANFLKNQIKLLTANGVSGPFPVYSYIPGHLELPLREGKIKVLPDEVIDQQIEVAKLFLKWIKEEKFPQLIYTSMDEAHCKGEPYWTEQVRLITSVKKAVPEVLTLATESDRSYWRLKEYLDIPLLFEVDDFRVWRFKPEDIAKGREIWSYPNQAMLEPADINAGRFCTGWLPALTGLRGIVPWQIYEARDYNESWLKNSCWSMFIPRSVGGFRVEPRTVTVMGHIGIWDLRYVETLRSLIDRAERKGSVSARSVAAEMKEMLQRIDETAKGSYIYYYKTSYWAPEVFVTLRERVTDGILRLKRELESTE